MDLNSYGDGGAREEEKSSHSPNNGHFHYCCAIFFSSSPLLSSHFLTSQIINFRLSTWVRRVCAKNGRGSRAISACSFCLDRTELLSLFFSWVPVEIRRWEMFALEKHVSRLPFWSEVKGESSWCGRRFGLEFKFLRRLTRLTELGGVRKVWTGNGLSEIFWKF